MSNKPKVAVYKFSSCDGCQLQLLNLEDELIDLAGAVDLAFFLEARRQVIPGPYDVGIIEGSVTTPEEAERIQHIRQDCKFLITIGTCATAGGVQALRNFADVKEYARAVYAHPEYLDTLATSTPMAAHVKIDLELWGCPVNKYQLLDVIAALIQQRKPAIPQYSVCLDCKRRGTTCITVAQGVACLGPITQSGCGAICPAYGRGCYGCFGPVDAAELKAFIPVLKASERMPGEAVRLLRTISGAAPAFVEAADLILLEEAKHA
jgi:coenzyme F420-reducing hydrogenase gamma subunit